MFLDGAGLDEIAHRANSIWMMSDFQRQISKGFPGDWSSAQTRIFVHGLVLLIPGRLLKTIRLELNDFKGVLKNVN